MATKKPKPLEEAIIIAIYNQKGGCGKTQTTMQLGGALGARGYRSLIVDMDPQGTSSIWSAQATEEAPFPSTVISLSSHKENLVKEIRKFSKMYDFILIDCPPAIESTVPWAALNIADLGLIPIIPLIDNIWASREAVRVGVSAQKENPDLQLRFLPSNVGRGNLYLEGLEIIRGDAQVKTLDAQLSHRNAFPASAAFGSTVHGLASKSPAIQEVEKLTTAVLKLFNIKG